MPDLDLDPVFLQRLDRFALVSRRRLASQGKGERRSYRRGTSTEFVDYRHYVPGDDVRQIDWNIYGRLDHLFLKLFEDEQTFTVHLLLDVSRSMDWGQPTKLRAAIRLAATLGYVALTSYDRLAVAAIGEGVIERHGPVRGRGRVHALFEFLAARPSHGSTNLDAALKAYAQGRPAPGLVVLISDLLSPHGFQEGVKHLLQKRFEVAIVQVLAPNEVNPVAGGDFRLVDRETRRAVDITLDHRAIDMYKQRLDDWTRSVADFCRKHGVLYHRIQSDTSLEEVFFRIFRRERLIQ